MVVRDEEDLHRRKKPTRRCQRPVAVRRSPFAELGRGLPTADCRLRTANCRLRSFGFHRRLRASLALIYLAQMTLAGDQPPVAHRSGRVPTAVYAVVGTGGDHQELGSFGIGLFEHGTQAVASVGRGYGAAVPEAEQL